MYDSSSKLVSVITLWDIDSDSKRPDCFVYVCDRFGVRRTASFWGRDSPIDSLWYVDTPVRLGYVYVPCDFFLAHVERYHYVCVRRNDDLMYY